MLTWTIWISFLGAGLLMVLPTQNRNVLRWFALVVAVVPCGIAFHAFFAYNIAQGGYQFGNGPGVPWIPQFGIHFRVGVDGISLPLVVLTGIIAFTGVLYSWNIEERVREFFAFFFVLIGGVYGVFQALDLFLLFVFYEIAIVPKYFIIAIWGSTRKEYGAMKLVLYSFIGSALVLVGALALYFVAGLNTFDLEKLATAHFAPTFQFWVFPLVFLGFAVLAGMWPFHTWAPTGHVAAPTAASMLLAGVVMKLGAYGCLRVAVGLFPEGLEFWKWPIAIIATINVLYGAMVALVQRDFKFVIGYSSVSHMGFVLLGLATLNVTDIANGTTGFSGAVLQMFSHGIVAGLLFACVGRMVYDRTHTRELSELGGLIKAMPFVGVVFITAAFASMGLPGFSGFFAELMVLIGTWRAFPWLLVFLGMGLVITVVYTLRTIHKAFFGDRKRDMTKWEHLPPITLPEKVASLLLVAILVIVGLYPPILLNMIEASSKQFATQIKARTHSS